MKSNNVNIQIKTLLYVEKMCNILLGTLIFWLLRQDQKNIWMKNDTFFSFHAEVMFNTSENELDT